jgi:hypothetical protein
MLRLASRCVRHSNPAKTIKYFSSLRPNALNVPRKSFPRPLHVIKPRRLISVEAKTAADSLNKGPSPSISAEEDVKVPITQRLKILFKKYRWPALTVYLGLGVLDFGIAFLAVQAFGTENIGRYEKIILKKVEDTIGWKTKGTPPQHLQEGKQTASIWTELALAYTIHKTLFALIRVPVTVAITPPLVKWYAKKGYGAVLAQLPAVGRLFQNSPAAVAARK